MSEYKINTHTLTTVLSKMLSTDIASADYQAKALEGGTIGNVLLVTGTAYATGGKALPYSVVYKKTAKFKRHNDPDSWRREYDLYASELGTVFSESLRWPMCYHSEISSEENQLWLEYIPGVTGLDMTPHMCTQAAHELGRLQGKLYATQPGVLQSLTNLSNTGYLKSFYTNYRTWPEVYDYIRNSECELPKELCKMLVDIDEQADEIFQRIEKLPIVLCHRDFWVTNILCTPEKIALIDWDTTGWGYFGEDIASLIADDADIAYMVENFITCIPAYYKGFAEYADISHIKDNCVYEIILLMYGYRTVEGYKFAKTPEDKMLCLSTLQKMYEMKAVRVCC
ncbi:MAG: aminoglycoside phosphotransferase family protein [Defluviitaleaceae bacterium]|nr:aminoglycoside phosphotransferase family protein [Defluviitaleaceae bacterium]